MPTHLCAHSYFSFLRAASSPEDLVAAAVENGMEALALTDHASLAGSVHFYQECLQSGVKPILGIEILCTDQNQNHTISLLACNNAGWSNLCKISTFVNHDPHSETPCTLSFLASHDEGLIAITHNIAKDDSLGWLKILQECFSDRLYIGLSGPAGHQSLNFQIPARLARENKLPMVAIHPIYEISPSKTQILRTLEAIRTNQSLANMATPETTYVDTSFANLEQLKKNYRDFPEALAETEMIAARCELTLPIGKSHFPLVPLPDGQIAFEVLRTKSEEGCKRIYGKITPTLRDRLNHELTIIGNRGYETIFLIVEEIFSFARKADIPISSRGSAASSLVAHCLGITSPDPMRLDLYFERFLNPARKTPPDIDTDICSRRRDLVLEHVFDVYGESHAAMVGTINRFRPRSALSDVAKAHGIKPALIREISSQLPHAYFHRQESLDEEDTSIPVSPYSELRQSYSNAKYQLIFDQAETILKLPRHLSVHAGGMVISPFPLTDLVSVQKSGSKGIPITQMDKESIEALGLVKIDLLGIRGLTVMGDVASAIQSWRRIEYRTSLDVLEQIPLHDLPTSETISRGETIGCFQIESPGMRATLKEISAKTEEDIIAALALYRPGPLKGGLKDSFVRRINGQEPVQHIHPALAPLLEDTYGVILYQEQVLRIANQLAGFSLTEADLLRRAMSHFDPGKEMQTLKAHFLTGVLENHHIPFETGEKIWELMAAFVGYGFPKAHAASYASIAWRSAWCKTHFPAEFMAAVLANWGGYYRQNVYINETRKLGLNISAPHVNHSQKEFCVIYPEGMPILFMGLDQVRDLTQSTRQRILQFRPFHTLDEFLSKVNPRKVEAQNLASIGALDNLAPQSQILHQIREGAWKAGQPPLFSLEKENAISPSISEKMAAQKNILGISLELNPLDIYQEKISSINATSTVDALEKKGQRVTLVGMLFSGHRRRSAKGGTMFFLSLEDREGTIDAVIFPDVYRRVRNEITYDFPLHIIGIVEFDSSRGETVLRVERVFRIE